jgi:hypothetical protein
MKIFIAAFEAHILYNKQKGRHTNGEAQDVDIGKGPVLIKVSISYAKVVSDH